VNRVIIVPDADLRASLAERGLVTVDRSEASGGLILRPRPSQETHDSWSAAAQATEEVFRAAQAFMASATSRATPAGHLVILIPADHAMGDPEDLAGSILAGTLISLVRTFALEFRKPGLTANCVFFDVSNGDIDGLDTIAELVSMLTSQTQPLINGQEIFASGGRDSGRRRP